LPKIHPGFLGSSDTLNPDFQFAMHDRENERFFLFFWAPKRSVRIISFFSKKKEKAALIIGFVLFYRDLDETFDTEIIWFSSKI
jgi:hypothetical protein